MEKRNYTEYKYNLQDGIEKIGLYNGEMVSVGTHGIAFVDGNGNDVFPPIVRKDGTYFFLNSDGVVTNLEYDYIDKFSEGLAAVRDKSGKWGYIDEAGKEVIPCMYAGANKFSCGYAAVQDPTTRKWGYIDKYNRPICGFKYYTAYDFSEGIGIVYNGKYYGAIDAGGIEIIPLGYNFLGSFENGRAYACINANYFYVDRDGNYVCDEFEKPHTRTR